MEQRQRGNKLGFKQITAVTRSAVDLGITKVRLTGGEPLVRRGIVELVSMLAAIEGLEILAMTTNGILLPRYAAALYSAGLKSVNISLDTLDAERYRYLTRGGRLADAIAGVEAAREVGFTPIKINAVIGSECPPADLEALERFCNDRNITLQRIGEYHLDREKVDFDSFDRPPKCQECNRLRLTSDGFLKPCLHTDTEIAVDFGDIEDSIRQAVAKKPFRGTVCTNRDMVSIGG